MSELFYSIITFICIYTLYLFFVIYRKKSFMHFKNMTEVRFLVAKYQLNLGKMNLKSLAHIIALTNSFLISITVFIVSIIDHFVLKIIIAMGIMIPLILFFYALIGRYYKKKEKY